MFFCGCFCACRPRLDVEIVMSTAWETSLYSRFTYCPPVLGGRATELRMGYIMRPPLRLGVVVRVLCYRTPSATALLVPLCERGTVSSTHVRTCGIIVPLWEEGRAQRREFEITHRGFWADTSVRPLRLGVVVCVLHIVPLS